MKHINAFAIVAAITLLLFISRKLITETLLEREVPHTIILNFRQPVIHSKKVISPSCENLKFLLKTPSPISSAYLESKSKSPCIVALYGGIIAAPDINGQIIFPRYHYEDEITLVVTKKIRPVMLRDETVEYFIGLESKMVLYKITRKKEKKGGVEEYSWQIIQEKNPPKKIPPLAIVLLAEPNKLCIPVSEKEKTVAGPNLVIPPIFITEEPSDEECISTLKIAQRYLPLRYNYLQAENKKQYARKMKQA